MYGYFGTPTFTTTAPQWQQPTVTVTAPQTFHVGDNSGLTPRRIKGKNLHPVEKLSLEAQEAERLAKQAEASFRKVEFPHYNRPITYAVPHPVPTFVQTISHSQHGLLPAAAHMFQNVSHSAPVIMGKQQLEQHIANLLQQIAILKQQHPDVAAALLKNVEAMIEKTAAASKTAFNVAV